MTFQKIVNLHAYQGLPLQYSLRFEEQDPGSPLHTRPLTITSRMLRAQVSARPKSKAYEINILEESPAVGTYEFLINFGGVDYPIEVELEAGEGAKELQAKIIAAIKGLLLALAVCAPHCSDVYEINVVSPWPGVEWTLALVDQPEDDQVEVEVVQDNAPLAIFTVTSSVVVDQLVVAMLLPAAVTAVLPAAGDGPYRWHLTAIKVTDPGDPDADPPVAPTLDRDDQLLLARGHLTVGRA